MMELAIDCYFLPIQLAVGEIADEDLMVDTCPEVFRVKEIHTVQVGNVHRSM